MAKKITRRVFINKRTKQLTVPLSRKQIKANNPKLKFGKHLFIDIELDSIRNIKKKE